MLRDATLDTLQKGDLADVFGQFYDKSGNVTTPTAAILHVQTPAGVQSTPTVLAETAPNALTLAYEAAGYNLGIDPGPYYRYQLDLQEEGTYTGKWNATGVGQSATPDFKIVVRDTVF
jgi:hypothetical protein